MKPTSHWTERRISSPTSPCKGSPWPLRNTRASTWLLHLPRRKVGLRSIGLYPTHFPSTPIHQSHHSKQRRVAANVDTTPHPLQQAHVSSLLSRPSLARPALSSRYIQLSIRVFHQTCANRHPQPPRHPAHQCPYRTPSDNCFPSLPHTSHRINAAFLLGYSTMH